MGQKSSAFLLGQKKIICSLNYSSTSWVQSLGGKDSLEEGMATHSSILACRIPWIDEPGGLESTGSQRWTQLKQLSTRTPHDVMRVKQDNKHKVFSITLG